MDKDERDPLFMDHVGSQMLCFDTCDGFLSGCRDCDRIKQLGLGSMMGAEIA